MLVGQIGHDRTGFHQVNAIVAINDRRNLVVGTDRQEFRRGLIPLTDIDGMDRVFNTQFFQQN